MIINWPIMKTIKKRLRPIALFLTALLLFQSCVVYHKTPTTLEKASQEHIKTRVLNANGETAKYNYISHEHGRYYGVHKDFDERGKLIKTLLNEQEITKITTKNKSASTWVTVGVIAVPVIAIALFMALDSVGPGNPWGSGV